MQGFQRRASSLVAAAVQLVWLLFAGPVPAEPNPDDRALATALFFEGRALMAEGRTADACPKLDESHRLDPSGGTILNLALCHEQDGHLARSWSEFQEALSFARRDQRSDRTEAAESHIAEIEPRLSRLTIVVSNGVRVDGLRIERDGRELGQPAWSTPMPVDGGEHIVRATAPGKLAFTATVFVGNESDARTLEVPPLADVPPTLAPAPVAPTPTRLDPSALATRPVDRDVDRGGATRQTIAWSIGAAGLLQWSAASYFGLRAFRKHAESNSSCHDNRCTPAGVEANGQAQRAADISTGLALTGLATVATSLYLLLTSPEEIHAAPYRSPTRFALGIWGTTIAADACF